MEFLRDKGKMNLLRVFLVLSGLFVMQSFPADAALSNTSRIIVVVNKDAITAGDVEERIRLINLSSGKPVTTAISEEMRKQVIQGMIDVQLQLQAAKSKKIKVDDAEATKALQNLAQDNKMTLDGMVIMLKSNGISKQTMITRLKAQMAWVRYIREMYGPLVHIADKEVDKLMAKAKEVEVEKPSPDFMDIKLCQAVFNITPETSQEVMMLYGPKIEETHQSKGCQSFLKTARGYGAKVEADRVVKLGELPGPLRKLVHQTKAGSCMEPVMTPDGLVLTMVCSKSMPKAAPPPLVYRETAFMAIEQEKLGKRGQQEMAKLKSVAFIEWK